MRDLANEAGVSVMTVSLALRNQPGVSAKTRELVQKLAEKKGYRPDPALSALINYRLAKSNHGHVGSVAFLNFVKENGEPASYIRKMYEGACEQAKIQGYRVYMFDGPTTESEATRLKRIFISRGIRGIILGPVQEKPPVFDWKDFSVVCLGVSLLRRQFHTISGDTYHSGFLCAAQLYHSGCRRIGVYFTEDMIDRVEQRYTGGAAAYLARKRDEVVFLPALYHRYNSRETFIEWYRKYKPDGLITGEGYVVKWMEKEGVPVPDGLSVASPHHAINLTHVNQRYHEWGTCALVTLGNLIKNNDLGVPQLPLETLVRGKLVHMGTTKGRELNLDQELDVHLSLSPFHSSQAAP